MIYQTQVSLLFVQCSDVFPSKGVDVYRPLWVYSQYIIQPDPLDYHLRLDEGKLHREET